jgi:putative PIN family toxin of toxin-antitoxin system
MRKTVLDTNVLIDGLMGDNKVCKQILDAEHRKYFDVVMSERTSEELINVIQYLSFDDDKETWSTQEVKYLFELLKKTLRIFRRMDFVEPEFHNENYCPEDDSDNKFVYCAIDGSADYIVTSNIKHYKEVNAINKNGNRIRVVRPLKFLREIVELNEAAIDS